MKNRICVAAVLLAASTCASALPPPGTIVINAKFTPSTVATGQSTTFTWSSTQGASCDVDGLPGGPLYGPNGSYSFAAQGPVTATVSCESPEDFNARSATLTISNAPPTVTTSFTPSTVYIGGTGSTFAWSSTMATSCSSPENASVSGTSGSIPIPAAASSSQQSITVNCSGPNGSGSSASTLTTTVAPPPPPSVYAFASPSYMMGPGFTSIYANYANATYCYGMGTYYVSYSTSFMVTCSGPGGSASSFAWVTVQQSMASGNFASMSTASKDVKPAAAKPIKAPASLKHLGIDLSKKRYAYVEGDLNRDGAMDLIVLDKAQQKVFVLLAKGAQYPAISKTVSNITALTQIKGVFVPTSNAPGEIRVTVENQQ